MPVPPTRHTLIGRLQRPDQQAAWDEFVRLYRGVIENVGRGRGLQPADAEDLAQDVLAIVQRRIGSFDPDAPGSFRGWLLKITRDTLVNRLTRGPRDVAHGGSDAWSIIAAHSDPDRTTRLWRTEHRRRMFAAAAERVRPNVGKDIWNAFWWTAVDGCPIADAARRLGKSEGSIRVARCRVLAKIRDEVRKDDFPYEF